MNKKKINLQINNTYLEYSFWKEILEVSTEQKFIDQNVLFKTLKLMLKNTHQDDPELIDLIKSIIVPPSKDKLNLDDKTGAIDFSQYGQTYFIDNVLKSKRNGFLIEAGAFDGEFQSNSIFFETQRNWSGILIEPIPSYYQRILIKNRKMYKINACISKDKPIVSKFRVYSVYSGRDRFLYDGHKNLIGEKGPYLYVPCFPLYSILKAINVSKVDFFSLDVEGGEYEVLSGLDFEKLNITTFVIEHLNITELKKSIKKILEENQYELLADKKLDYFFKKINK